MRNTFTTIVASLSTITPEVTETFDPTIITEGSSLVIQVITAVIAVISFVKSIFKKKNVEPKIK